MTETRDEISYYRDCQGHEVDFIFKGQAFEVKVKQSITARDVRGLLIFGQDYGAKLNVICTVDKKRVESFGNQNVIIWPIEEFLEALWNGQIF